MGSSTLKICRLCGLEKARDEFFKSTSTKDKLHGECKACHRELGKHNYLQKKAAYDRRSLKGHLRRSYNMEIEEYDALLEAQKGLCAICGLPETRINNKSGKVQKLCVDHDHITGKNRALLCHRCNSTMGLLEENIYRLEQMAEYLKKWKSI